MKRNLKIFLKKNKGEKDITEIGLACVVVFLLIIFRNPLKDLCSYIALNIENFIS